MTETRTDIIQYLPELETSRLEQDLKNIVLAAVGKNDDGLRNGKHITRAILQEYQKRPEYSGILVGMVKIVYSILNENLDYAFN
jgi:hypothetical protein